MAYPQVADITATTVTSASTTHNISMPATVNANDLLLVLFANGTGGSSVTTPSGWTSLGTNTTTNIRLTAYGKIASGSEDGTTVNFVTASSNTAAAQVYRITGDYHDLTTAGIELAAASGTSTTPNSPNLNPANWDVEETLWITAGACSNAVSGVTTYPTSYTGGTYTQSGSTAGVDAQLASARRENSVDAENPGAFTFNAIATWIAITVAIRPAFITQSIEAPLITNEPTFYDPSMALQGLLIPPLLDLAVAPIAPTLTYEQLLVMDAVLTNEPTFYGPTMGLIYTLAAPLITNAPTFYGVTIANTQIMASPLITNSPTFYGPTIIGGSAAMIAPLISNSQTFYGPTVFTVWTGTDSLTSGTWTDTDIAT